MPPRSEARIPEPSGKPDLGSPDEIRSLVETFYGRVRRDALLAPVFVEQAQVDWEEHIPKLTAFWCKLELGIPGFHGAPTQKHSALSSVVPFRAEQFERWVALFHDTVDREWRGPHADSIKARATQIASVQSRVVSGAQAWGSGEPPPPR
ncbi:MAG: group III truncated hemoglobin [Planctomycetota bacterium]